MSRIYMLSDNTATRRRFPIYLVDATDGITPETGEAGGQPQLAKNGGAFVNTAATLTSVGNGNYYVEFTGTEINTLGMIQVRFKSANTAEFAMDGQVVNLDPYTALPLALVSMFEGALEAAVDNGTFTPTTTQFETDQTDDDAEEWTNAALFWTAGPNIGTTVFVTAYEFANSKVKLTVSLMEAAPLNSNTFIRMGRKA